MMPGESWNRLVLAPTATEVDAALAEVRVRAIGHARSSARRRRALRAFGAVALLGVGVAGGRMSVGEAVRSLDSAPAESNSAALPQLVRVPVATPPVPGPVHRFHITGWTELEGVRMNEGEAYVEGPPGTSFELRAFFEGSSFEGRFWVNTAGDSTGYMMWGEMELPYGRSRRGLRLVEKGRAGRGVTARHGESVVVYPFGEPRPGRPVTKIRIDGPYAPPPEQPVRWHGMTRNASLFGTPAELCARANAGRDCADERQVRYGFVRFGGFFVTPGFTPQPVSVRFTLRGQEPSAVVEAPAWGNGTSFTIPGLADSVRVTLARPYPEGAYACVHLQPGLNSPGRWPNVTACFPASNPWAPALLQAPGVGHLKVELVRPSR